MTEETFKEWIDNIVIPSHPSLFPFVLKKTVACPIRGYEIITDWKLKDGIVAIPEACKVGMLLDGDYSHIKYANLVYIKPFMHTKPPPPYSSGRMQSGDAKNGTNMSAKDAQLPKAQANRQTVLARAGVTRQLDRTDVPAIVKEAYPRGFSTPNQNSSNDTVGLVPFTRRPLHEEDIQATKGDESVTDKCQLDLTKIRFHYNRGELEAGGEELAKQLSGSKWGTGKMARFCSTDDSFIMVAGLAD